MRFGRHCLAYNDRWRMRPSRAEGLIRREYRSKPERPRFVPVGAQVTSEDVGRPRRRDIAATRGKARRPTSEEIFGRAMSPNSGLRKDWFARRRVCGESGFEFRKFALRILGCRRIVGSAVAPTARGTLWFRFWSCPASPVLGHSVADRIATITPGPFLIIEKMVRSANR